MPKRFSHILLLCIIGVFLSNYCIGATAQEMNKLPPERAKGFLVPACIEANGDTIPFLTLPQVVIFKSLTFNTEESRRAYNKLVRDVKRTLPFAKLVSNTLLETYEYMETLPNDKARHKHLKRMEKELYKEYKPVLKKLTLSQGKLLLKLITRECGTDSYHLIDSFLGGFAATFWNSFANIFGASLKSDYDPEGADRIIERICQEVEQGSL